MAIDTTLMTLEEFQALDDDGYVHELLRGELIRMAPPGKRHGRLVQVAVRLFAAPVEDTGLGTVTAESGTTVGRNPDSALGPDLAIYLGEIVDAIDEPEDYGEDIPDIVVEVVSPSDRAGYIQDKIQTYLDAGVKMAIVIWPRRREITVSTPDGVTMTLGEAEIFDGGELLPGVTIPVRRFFVRQ